MVKRIVIELSDKAYGRLKEIAEIKETSVEEESFGYSKKWLNNTSNEQFLKRLDDYKKDQVRRKEVKFYNKYPIKRYVLKKWKNGTYLILEWRMAKYPEYITHPSYYDKVGYYICWTEKRKDTKLFSHVIPKSRKEYKFKSLKSMKRKINSLFNQQGYENHYVVK